MDKVLNLTLHKQWFKQILEGTKRIEYRDVKEYWTKRLVNDDGSFKKFDKIVFKNGYAKDAPIMIVELLEIREVNGKYELMLGTKIQMQNLGKLNNIKN